MQIDNSHFVDRLNIDCYAADVKESLPRSIRTYSNNYGNNMFGHSNWEYIKEHIEDSEFSRLKDMLYEPISPIACYVFYNFQQDRIARGSSSGDVQSVTDNSRAISSDYRMRIAWNLMVESNRDIARYLMMNKEIFEENLDYCDLFPRRSMFEYLNDFGIW